MRVVERSHLQEVTAIRLVPPQTGLCNLATVRHRADHEIMSTFAEQQVSRLESLLAANTGVESVMVGNRSVKYGDLLKQYDYWKSIVARESGSRPRSAQINLSGF